MRRWVNIALAAVVLLGVGGLWMSRIGGQFAAARGVTMASAAAPDPGHAPLSLYTWYPAKRTKDGKLPLIVLSHGTGGSGIGHADTANALAKAGFIVVAMDHTGDNYRDTGHVGNGTHLTERPRHISRTLDYMLGQWPLRGSIDPERIGMFGFSAGGFTALAIAGAQPDLSRSVAYCRKKPMAWSCEYLRKNGFKPNISTKFQKHAWQADARVKAAAIAAPAVGYSFDRAALAGVKIPVQIWAAERDEIVDDSAETVREAFPYPPEFRLVEGAGHFAFLMPCNVQMSTVAAVMGWFGTEGICADRAGFDRDAFHAGFNRSLVQFFERTLSGRNDISWALLYLTYPILERRVNP